MQIDKLIVTNAAPIAIDYHHLIAALIAVQMASRSAVIEHRLDQVRPRRANHAGTITTLLLGEPDWVPAIAALQGAFHPATGRRMSNAL
jgi:hypothetical protein